MSTVTARGRGQPDHPPARHVDPEAGRAPDEGAGERMVSLAAGSLLVAFGLRRRNVPGLLLAGVGGTMLARGALQSPTVQAIGRALIGAQGEEGLRIAHSVLIDAPADELYRAWRDLERLPSILTHLERVRRIDERRSHWVARAPRVAGGRVEWDAEIVRDEPGVAIAWRSLPESEVQTAGEIRFQQALGHRGTIVHVALDYRPPGGRLGALVATLTGVGARRQVREDLRAFKRRIETGEPITIEGQPAGRCGGLGRFAQTSGRTS